MKTFVALMKREILDGKNGYVWTPVILAGLTVALVAMSAAGFGNVIEFNDMEVHNIGNFSEMLARGMAEKPDDIPAGMTIAYWGMSVLTWIAFPFVVFFSLLGSLYEERRDRSILFWKSMPVADWMEVLAKLVTPIFVSPFIFLGVVIAAQLAIAILLSLVVIVQGGPVLALWPLGLMVGSWFSMVGHYMIWALWALPILAWVLLVSAYANRMPFLWAVLTPVVLMVVEELLFDTQTLAMWIGDHLAGWQGEAFAHIKDDFQGPRDVFATIIGNMQWDALTYSVSNPSFWIGLVIAGGFVFGAIELRKRAV
ncbi:MAG: hypothetical protein EP335_06750 [Alphaproteobacteria bacterium]|nr:MAG: hypothetical protein EP335_06750 [Alphaproteobacteria bacterium]